MDNIGIAIFTPQNPPPGKLEYSSDYTTEPTHIRVYFEETGDARPWHIDGADNDGNYTEKVWRYETFRQALDAAGLFVSYTSHPMNGPHRYQWKWDTARKTKLRRV